MPDRFVGLDFHSIFDTSQRYHYENCKKLENKNLI